MISTLVNSDFLKFSFCVRFGMKSKIRGTFLVVSVSRPCHLEAGSNEGTVITIEGISMCSARRRRWFSRLLSAAVPAFFSAGGRRRRVCRLKSGLEHSVTGQWSDRTLSDPSQFISIVTGHTVSLVSNRQKTKKLELTHRSILLCDFKLKVNY